MIYRAIFPGIAKKANYLQCSAVFNFIVFFTCRNFTNEPNSDYHENDESGEDDHN